MWILKIGLIKMRMDILCLKNGAIKWGWINLDADFRNWVNKNYNGKK